MKIAVITNNALKDELLAQGLQESEEVQWLNEPQIISGMDFYIDLLFSPTEERLKILQRLSPAVVIVNAVSTELSELPENFVRINGWPTFLKRTIMEASCRDEKIKEIAENLFACFNKKTEWVPDVPGFVSARVVSMIINEAYFALEENVSSKPEIDTAMKLGTNYPYGPFEWAEKIGLQKVYELLTALEKTNARYQPCALLKKEIQS